MLMRPGDALLFDLGGVVIDIDINRVFSTWAAHAAVDAATIKSRRSRDKAHNDYETGKISLSTYFTSLRSSLGINLTDDQFFEGWNAIFVGEMPGISRALEKAARRTVLFAFSNTNSAHEEFFTRRFAEPLAHFSEIFVSSRIGLRKPDQEAFRFVAEKIGLPADRIIFFDDLAENVEGAKRFGMKTVHVTSSATIPQFMAENFGD